MLLRTRAREVPRTELNVSNRPQGTTLAPRGPITSGQGSATARLAGRHMAGVARVAPANGVASWQQRPGPGSRHQGQATGWTASGLIKHTCHSLTPGAHRPRQAQGVCIKDLASPGPWPPAAELTCRGPSSDPSKSQATLRELPSQPAHGQARGRKAVFIL